MKIYELNPWTTVMNQLLVLTYLMIMQFCRWLALRDYPPTRAIFLATAIPTVVTGTFIVCMHIFSGTPAPLMSSLPPVTLGLISFFILSRSLVFED